MNFIESFNSKTILIPLLQRDYVQGGREDVIAVSYTHLTLPTIA